MAGAIRGRRSQGGPWERRKGPAPFKPGFIFDQSGIFHFARLGAKNSSDLPEAKLNSGRDIMKHGNKILPLLGWMAFLGVMGLLAPLHAQESDQPLQEALQKQQAVQEEVQAWSEEKQALVQKILSLQTKKKWLQLQNEQHAAYIQQKENSIDRLEEQEEVARSLRMELEPYLSEVVDKLEARVEADLPFLPQEREDRLQFINQSLTEYGVSLSERLRRVLEALTVEAGYGTSVGVNDRELDIEGSPVQAQVVRLGRVGLLYVTPDGGSAGMWDRGSQEWKYLDQDMAKEVQKTVDIIQERRVAELVTLPLGQLEE
jgi:hypothetical protein